MRYNNMQIFVLWLIFMLFACMPILVPLILIQIDIMKDKKTENTAKRKEKMLEALKKSLGVVAHACEVAGIERCTHYKWLKEDPEYNNAVNALDDVALDFAETQLFKQMKEGSTAATIFYLKTRGKKRGYVERTEITGADGSQIEFKIEVVQALIDKPFLPE